MLFSTRSVFFEVSLYNVEMAHRLFADAQGISGMNSIQMKGINSTLSQVVLENINYLKQHLDGILINSDRTLIENLIEETEFLLEQVKSSSRTYQEKYNTFNQLNASWFDAWRHYKGIPEAIGLIRLIDRLTNFSTAYSYLFLSLSLINEGKTGEDKSDLERVVSGFLLLSEIVDVFISFFSISELKQIHNGAKNAISISVRGVEEYFENGLELSNLVTQLKAYSSLIILKIGEHVDKLEELEQSNRVKVKTRTVTSSNKQLRPFGLCTGEFIVPDGFEEPLSEETLNAFEGK